MGTGLLVLLVVGSLLVACGQGATTGPEVEETVEEEAGTIKFAVSAPMSGDVAEFGEIVLQGVETATDEINAAGGIEGKQIELVPFDDKCDSTEAATVAGNVVTRPEIFAVLGPMCSGATMASMPIYEEAGLTALTASSSRTDLTKQGWTHLFRSITHDLGYGPILAEIAVEHLGAEKVAIFYAPDDYGVGLKDAVVDSLNELGGNEIVALETFIHGDKDFSPQLTKIANEGAEVIMLITEYTEGALIAKQRVAAGLGDIPIVCASTMQFPAFIELGGEAVEGAIVGAAWDRWSQDPGMKAFNDKWAEMYGEPANELNALYYDAVYIMKEAIEQGGTKDTLHEVLREIKYEGPTGTYEFDETGEVKPKQLYALQVVDGEFTSYDLSQ
jgi:branched-chain amino acid transport system substrate-binding protein